MSRKAILAGAICIPVVAAVTVVVLTTMAANGTDAKDGKGGEEKVITTKSGLKYADLKVGDGATAKEGSKVKVHYTGTLENGKKFDSSLDRGTPFELTIGNHEVIKGWEEGLQGMKVGGKRKLIIPPDLAYGDRGRPPVIPEKATLIFEVELVDAK